MSLQTIGFELQITPGAIPPVLHLSQYDSGRTFTAMLMDGGSTYTPSASATAKLKGFNAAGVAWELPCSISGNVVTFAPSGAATDQFGVMPVTIEITEDGETITPLVVVFDVQRSGYTNEEAVRSPEFETAMEAAAQAAVDQAIIEVGGGLTEDIKAALMDCFNHVAWSGTSGQEYIDALEAALYPPVTLEYITAVYNQTHPVYTDDTLVVLKDDLLVYAHYSNDTELVTDYTLSGTLSVGTSTITVTFGGKTATFTTTVTSSDVPLPSGYTRVEYIERPTNTVPNAGYNSTGFALNGTDDAVIKMGVMLTGTPSSNSGGYFLACRQTNSDNTIGFGVYATKDTLSIGAYDGDACLLQPTGGQTVVGEKFDLVVTKTPTTLTVTDGTNTNTVTRTPRVMASNLYVFALYPYTGNNLAVPVFGRIYYLKIYEAGVLKVNLVPCIRTSDNAKGFWNTVAEEFKSSVAYVAGPEV